MSGWDERYGTGGSQGGGSSRDFSSQGGVGIPGGMGGVYHPTPGTTAPGVAEDASPGRFSINPLDPGQTAKDAVGPINGLLEGLKDGIFGTSQPDAEGSHGGVIGDVPILGAGWRAISETVANVGGAAGAVLTDGVGGALERTGTLGNSTEALDAQYNSDAVQAWLDEDDPATGKPRREQLTGDNGLGGTGLFSNADHMKSVAIRKYAEDQQYKNPTLAPGAFTTPGSLADVVTNLFDGLDVSAKFVASKWSQLDSPGQAGMDRIDIIQAVGRGEYAFDEDKGFANTGILAGDPTRGLNPLEQLVFNKLEKNEWTRDEAADFLASNGQAYGHGAIANIGGSLALDPLNIATLGAGAIAKVGMTGVKVAQGIEKTALVLQRAEEALSLAEDAAKAAKGVRAATKAEKAVTAARGAYDEAKTAVDAAKAYQSGGAGIRGANILARGVEGSTKVQKGLQVAGTAYGALEGSTLGRAAKLTRTIIDPFHALDLHMPGASKAVDLLSDAVPATVVNTGGVHHYKGLLDDMLRLDSTQGTMTQFVKDVAVASTNMAREGVTDLFRKAQIDGGLTDPLMKSGKLPEDLIPEAMKTTKQKDLNRWLREQAHSKVYQEGFTEAEKRTLAKSLEQTYHVRNEEQWMEAFGKMSKEQLSLLKFANYGAANRRLLDFTATMSEATRAKLPFPANRMVLLAKGTLSRVGAESLLTQLSAKGLSSAKRAKLIREWQELYPSLRYIALDPSNLGRSIDDFVENLGENIERYPMQMTSDEIAGLGDEADDLTGALGEYGIGFRPEDKFLWGLERDNATGLYRPATGAWADHVADAAMPYRPANALRLNIAGHPLVDVPVVRAGVRAIDHIDSAARLMKSQVSSAMVTESARKRFIARAASGELAERGVTEQVAESWFKRIMEYTREHQGYSGPRGFGGDDLFNAIKKENLVPQTLLSGDRALGGDDIMRLVLEAYDGDVRIIGLTQKLSGRAKRFLFEATGSNVAGQIAEHAWPTMKFRYNPIFQLQEKVEPWVLNTQRGVSSATGVKMSEADRATEALLHRMTNNSLVRQADLDQFEYSSAVLFGKKSGVTAATPGTALNRIQTMSRSLTEVQGMKRVNMLRTFRKGLGKDIRAAWDEARPGEFDQMLDDARVRSGKLLMDEDEFALQMVSENMYGNDIIVNRLGGAMKTGGLKADWANAIKTGEWHAPTNLGELKALDLDHIATSLRLSDKNGKDIADLNGLRGAIATDKKAMLDKVEAGLRALGADKDYVRRVRNGLDFSWGGFWKTAEKRFSLTSEESTSLQDMMAEAAKLRGMTPVEFMSQVFSPGLIDGTEGTLGYLEGPARMLREARAAGRKVKGRDAKFAETRSQLAGKEGVSTREDLVRQLSQTFSAHLDPSAKRALLMEFRPELKKSVLKGESKLDLQELQDMWDAGAENDLANRIIGYMDGKQPTHAFDELEDDARGIKDVRDAATRYMQELGVEPLNGRPHFKRDADMDSFYEEGAAHYRDLPDLDYEKTGRIPNARGLNRSDLELKPQPAGVDDATYSAYRSFVQDTRTQYDFISKPKSKGGLGVKVQVTRTDPYEASEAGRAAMKRDIANGKLKVLGASSDHPLMTNEQNVMFRAVHDLFGHSAEGFEFGPRGELNAAAKHARMYSNEGRPAMLTETHGQTSYVNYSDDIYEGEKGFESMPLDPANPADSFEERYPFAMPESQVTGDPDQLREGVVGIKGSDEYGVRGGIDYGYTQRVGNGIRSQPPEVQAAILQPMADLFDEFPNLRVHHIDAVPFSSPLSGTTDDLSGLGEFDAYAVTWGSDADEAVVIFNTDHLELQGADWAGAKRINELQKQYTSFNRLNPATGKVEDLPRRSRFGAPHNAVGDLESISRHEAGHAFDVARRPRKALTDTWVHTKLPEHADYYDMVSRFEKDAGRLDLSEYGMTNSAEFMAELFTYTTDPKLIVKNIESPTLRSMVEEFQTYLKDSGEWVPVKKADPMAGKTIREVNAAKRGSVYAPQKGALLPQSYLDDFTDRFVGRSRFTESNPDVARAAQMFGKWSDAVVNNGLLRGDKAVHSGILQDIAGIPTGAAVPYNFSEGAAVNLATQAMVRKWDDAFRLQYFAQERTFLERSLNHPMFGLYPASYMWGKIMPEMVRFIASEPFGNKTGGLLYGAMDVQASIAMRREYDPYFDANIEKLGHSQAMGFAGYMLPALPWDVGASAPGWMNSIAEQGLANQKAVDQGGTVDDISLTDAALAPIKKLNPLETTIPWAGRAASEVAPGGDDEAVKAAELGPTLGRVMQELQEALR